MTRVEIVEEAWRICDSSWVWPFRPQNRGQQVCRVWASEAAHGITTEFASRQSVFVKGSWPFDVHNSTWTIMLLRLSGLRKYLRTDLKMCNNSINKRRNCPTSYPSRLKLCLVVHVLYTWVLYPHMELVNP